MSAFHGERGGVTALRATPALQSTHEVPRLPHVQSSDRLQRHATARKPRVPASTKQSMTTSNVGQQSATADSPPTIAFPSADAVAQSELLQDAVFPTWKDDGATEGIETPEELQRKDPLGTQIWKLYSRTKTRLPNQERMENLTWRMMAMNLKRREKEQALYAMPTRKSFKHQTNKAAEQLKRPYLRERPPPRVALLSNFGTRSTKALMTRKAMQ